MLTEHENRTALVLVEAKANHPELSRAGKPIPRRRFVSDQWIEPSENSARNHARIDEAIAEADRALNALVPGFSLNRDRNYQLSNRLAFSWKLASLGIPTVLVYLGFTGDHGLGAAPRMLCDEADWRGCFARHTCDAIPATALGRWIEVGPAGFFVLLASRERLEDSPPPTRSAPRSLGH